MTPSALRCPRCDLPLEPFALDRATTIDTCARCRGAWFDRGELGQTLGTPRDLGDAPPDELPLAAPDAPTCPRCPGVCMLRVPYVVRGNAPSVDLCPHCEGVWTSLPSLARMREIAALRVGARAAGKAPSPAPELPDVRAALSADVRAELPTSLTFRQLAASVPVALACVAVVRSVTLGRFLMQGARVSLHELGHATVAWACGWMAIPLPVGFTSTSGSRSLGVHAMVLAGCGAGAWACARRGVWPVAAGLALYGLVGLVCTWGLGHARQDMIIVWGGCAGEMALGALLVAASLMDVPTWKQWGRVRWVLLALGACAFVDSSLFWRAAAKDWELIPWDAALADEGDMTILRDRYGWDERRITGRYVTLSWACLAAVLGAWGAALLRRRDEAREALRRG